MPIYEYRCPECDVVFSKRRRMSESDQAVECPECDAPNTDRMISTFSARGSGGKAIAGSGGGCSGCAATSCGSCTPR